MALKTMPIAKLQALKSQVEAAISAKVTERRRELESELSKLAGFDGRGKAPGSLAAIGGDRWRPSTATRRTRLRPGLAVASNHAG
jgi:hypothetical protein